MAKYDLSILIPARNEQWISNTVEDILKHKRGNTEVIVGLDGAWAEPGIYDHPDVRILYVSESIGQRAMTNKLARLSTAKYVAKCDAHVAFDEGFDVKLIAAMEGHDDWTIVPMMLNLHAWNWKCENCGKQTYQGPTPGTKGSKFSTCVQCGADKFHRKLIWKAKASPQSTSFCFDPEPHFQYFTEFRKRPEGKGDITPTMSLQGSFFMLTREKYWELNICDENFGSWGSQGIEVAVKTWLSGGQVMCLQTTWYAHMFRTQGGDFSFPYPQKQSQVEEAKAHARQLFFDGDWPLQKHPLSWLVEKFWPVYGWTQQDLDNLKSREAPTKGIIYYTDNQLNTRLAHKVQDQIRAADLPIVSASLKPMHRMGTNIVIDGERGYLTMFRQILAALEASSADIIFFCEHDVLYHPTHFDFSPIQKDKFYYNQNFWKVWPDGLVAHWEANQVSGLCCYKELAIAWYKTRVHELETGAVFNRSYEPGGRDINMYMVWNSPFPNIDIRHDNNLTTSHRSVDEFRDKSTATGFETTTIDKIVGWDNLSGIIGR